MEEVDEDPVEEEEDSNRGLRTIVTSRMTRKR